jgi:hypothetical protein
MSNWALIGGRRDGVSVGGAVIAGVSAETPCAPFHKPLPRKRTLMPRTESSVSRQKFRWLIFLVYAVACSDLGKVVSERIQDLIGGLGPVNGRGLAFGMS